jgi:hypothetical protein
MSDTNRQPISLGSGFFVADDVIATNMHVISGAASGRAKLIGHSETYDIVGSVGMDEEHDLVALKVAGVRTPGLPLGNGGEAVSVGDEVYAVGNPQGLEGTLSNGIVSAIREVEGQKLLQITAPISPGSSGGPVFDQHGQVIGIAVATFKGGQNLNFAVPASYLAKLLLHIGSVSPLSSNFRPSASLIDALGGRLTDGIQITHRKILCTLDAHLEFSIRNTLSQAVDDVTLLFIFKDGAGEPVDSMVTTYSSRILPGLATRPGQYWPDIPTGLLEERFTKTDYNECMWMIADQKRGSGLGSSFSREPDPNFIEIRVLGFRVLDEHP